MSGDLPPGFVLDQPTPAAAAPEVAGLPPGFVLDNPGGGSSVSGVVKSLGAGLAKGAIGLAGIPGDLAHLYAPNQSDPNPLGSEGLQRAVEARTGEFYKPQGTAEDIASRIGEFAPAAIGGPESLATKVATRVVAPALASEAAGKLTDGTAAQPYAEVAGALLGGAGAGSAANKINALRAARGAAEVPAIDQIKAAARAQYQHPDVQAVQIKPEVLSGLADTIENDLKYGPNSGYRPANEKQVFDAVDELRTPSNAAPIQAEAVRMGAGPVATKAPTNITQNITGGDAAPKAQSLLEFIASKGGLGPDAELEAIGAHSHTVNVDGTGRRKLVRQGGWPLDYAREAAEEAGYLRGSHNGTSTVNDLLDAMDAEMRGQKRFPEGFEGTKTKREVSALSEREQYEQDRHLAGFEDDLAAAGHGELGSDVKARAVHLMANEGADADTAVERALSQLEQEDNAVPRGTGFPGDHPAVADVGKPAGVPRAATVADLDNVRQVLGNAAKERDATGQLTRQAVAANRAIDHIDNFLPNLRQPDLLAGDAAKANGILESARKNWGAAKRAEQVQTLAKNAEINAASANSGGNLQNATKQAFKPLLKNNYAKAGGYTAIEKQVLNKIVRGTWTGTAARAAGNLLGGGGGLGMLAGGAAGYEEGGVPGAIAVGLAGRGLKKIGERSTLNAVRSLDTLLRSRAPEALKVAASNPKIVQLLPSDSVKALRAMILAEPGLAQVSNGPANNSDQNRKRVGQ